MSKNDRFITQAFILAAGKGTRLRPYTDLIPKPMVEVQGKTLIDRALDRLDAAGVQRVTINLHHKAEALKTHLAARTTPRIALSYEETLLDTGGAIKNALHTLDDVPFYVIAGDSLWTDGPSGDALLRLANAWRPDIMDILLLLQPVAAMKLTQGVGDYDIFPDGRAIRSPNKTGDCMWTNVRINSPGIFTDAPDGAFSFLDLMDRAEQRGRLHALIHDGDWHHISTPGDLKRVDDHAENL